VCVCKCVGDARSKAVTLGSAERFKNTYIYSVLQCVAVCCSVLQCVAVCCSVLQCVNSWKR